MNERVISLDVVIFGGGAAGLWLLDELTRAGILAMVLEAGDLGSGQTIASQGIIHGGLKYTLNGMFTSSARAISEMPLIWRRCLAGEAKPDLSGTRLRSDFCHLWRTASLKSRLAMIGAKAGLRVTPVSLRTDERPAALIDCPGVVARLDEQVIEPASLIATLSRQHADRIFKIDAESGLEFVQQDASGVTNQATGAVNLVRLLNPDTGEPLDIRPNVVVLTAGAGNAGLRRMIGMADQAMQIRPLHMAMARGNELPVLNGHCVDGMVTRVTITSTRDFDNRIVWQIGGQIAEAGVKMSRQELMKHAQKEINAVIPNLKLKNVQWCTYRADRAEPATEIGTRPDEPFAKREHNIITAWPTKLALVPEMARRVMLQIANHRNVQASRHMEAECLDTSTFRRLDVLKDWPRPLVALPPWETCEQWFDER